MDSSARARIQINAVKENTAQETTGKRILNALCAIAPFAISVVFSQKYFVLLRRANSFDEIYGEGAYDKCNMFVDTTGEEAEIEMEKMAVLGITTGWRMMYKFNAVFYLLLAIQNSLLMIGVYFLAFRYMVSLCNCCCTLWMHFFLICLTAIFRYRDFGTDCADTEIETSTEGDTFVTDG